jgi:hypothetical protein
MSRSCAACGSTPDAGDSTSAVRRMPHRDDGRAADADTQFLQHLSRRKVKEPLRRKGVHGLPFPRGPGHLSLEARHAIARMKRALPFISACVVFLLAGSLPAQDYRVRLDARAQSVSFRGLISDSILARDAVPGTSGGFETPDGHAVRCGAGEYCYFLRSGPVLRGVPVTAAASLIMWGLGVEGLSLRATGRVLGNLGSDEAWPGTEPSTQLIEGLLEYQRAALVARVGRQLVSSRLESMGFDGGWLKYRWDAPKLEITGYGGWGLGQATAVSPLSPALNPLDEWRPRNRQIVAGAEAALLYRNVDVRGEYRREVDPEDDYFVSERAALSFGALIRAFRLNAGLDYNMAEGHLGNADVALTYLRRTFSVTAGARRYRPYFSLWTLWGAFSPVPYNAVNISAQTRPTEWLSLHGRAERYSYESAGVSTALVQLEDRGWRARIGATATMNERWTFDGNYGLEYGPGAAARSADAALTFTPNERLALDVYGGSLARPLELRFYDATSRWIGGRIQWQQSTQRRLWGDVSMVNDDRDRPDASASSLDQVRVRAGISLAFGSGADRTPLPPARPTLR